MLSKISKKLWLGKNCIIHQKVIFSWWCVCMFSFFCWSLQVSWWKLEEGPLAREMGKVIAWKDFCKNFPFFTFQLSFFVVQRFNRKFYPFTFSCSLLLVLKCNICESKIIFLNYSGIFWWTQNCCSFIPLFLIIGIFFLLFVIGKIRANEYQMRSQHSCA